MRPFEIAAGSTDLPQRTLSAHGELDIATAGAMLAAVDDALVHPGATSLRLDLSDITFIDSVGIATLLKVHQIAAERGSSLDLSDASAAVQNILRLTGLAQLFGLAPALRGEDAGS